MSELNTNKELLDWLQNNHDRINRSTNTEIFFENAIVKEHRKDPNEIPVINILNKSMDVNNAIGVISVEDAGYWLGIHYTGKRYIFDNLFYAINALTKIVNMQEELKTFDKYLVE